MNAQPEVITYSLRESQRKSDEYYWQISDFTDSVLSRAKKQLGEHVDDFLRWVEECGRETPRTWPEYAFELLTLGTLWRVYGESAISLGKVPQRMLAWLVRLRQRANRSRFLVDALRGLLAAVLFAKQEGTRGPKPSWKNLERLLHWMDAAGDFKEERKRLQGWREYFAGLSESEAKEALERVVDYAHWFEVESLAVLGRYTPNVERFLAEKHPEYRFREDRVFCGRQRVEYHMNMVGTEILNRAFHAMFISTGRKVVLLPPCMRAKPSDECQATETPFGARCAACTPGCHVHQATKLGEKRGFDTFILPHELNVFSGGKIAPKRGEGGVGIVGVSCPLTNVTGGWETRELGIPAQGILLDYCGCSWHWDLDRGIPTNINFNQLLKVLEV